MSRLRCSVASAPMGVYFTPRSASGINATIMSALKMIALKIALFGLCRPMMFSGAMAGNVAINIAGMIAKYLATSLAMLMATFPAVAPLNVMGLHSPNSAILSAIIFNALIIIALIPLALRGVKFKPVAALAILQRNLLIYGLGGLLLPFVGIKVIDVLITTLKLV